MKRKIKNQFLINYVLMFIITTIIAVFALLLLGAAGNLISKDLVKNNYTAKVLIADDYREIEAEPVVKNGGGVQIFNDQHEILYSAGIDTFGREKLSTSEFTEFLASSRSIGLPYSYSVEYSEAGKFWLVVTFPTSLRFDIDIAHNVEYESVDRTPVYGVIGAITFLYFMLLAVSTVIYSRMTSVSVVVPLKKLCEGTSRLKGGDYSTRVHLNLNNEFGELEDIFNRMADQIEEEISLRKQSEDNRKRLVSDVAHDLKNPLASIMGYAEIIYTRPELAFSERAGYAKIIYENSLRANSLIADMFELSRLERSDYTIEKKEIDVSEYLRSEIGKLIPELEKAGFSYQVCIPEREVIAWIDEGQMNLLIQNLLGNALRYNPPGTEITIRLLEEEDRIEIQVKDDGIGIPEEIKEEIFLPFVRTDKSRNSKTGGTGLGLAIVRRIAEAHGGKITLKSGEGLGCEFNLILPKN